MNFFTDIAAASQVFGEIRKARKSGASSVNIKLRRTYTIPMLTCSCNHGETVEGCVLSWYPSLYEGFMSVFDNLPERIQRKLVFSPKHGEYVDRARFWKERLCSALPPKQYHDAMVLIIRHYVKCANLD